MNDKFNDNIRQHLDTDNLTKNLKNGLKLNFSSGA